MSPISKKHLIIGGLGSVGKHLQRVLLDQGKEVVVMDHPYFSSPVYSQEIVDQGCTLRSMLVHESRSLRQSVL